MNVIWKHQLSTGDTRTVLEMVKGATVIHFGEHHGIPVIWEMHDDSFADTEYRKFDLVGTGVPTEIDPERYIGTALFANGMYVFHLFEVT